MKKNNITEAKKAISTKAKAAIGALSGIGASLMTAFNAFALDINTDYTIKDPGTSFNPEGLIVGLALWICRLVGIGMLIWGIYGYVTARKDGEAEAMNGSLGKLISGVVLIGMPSVLQALGLFG